MKFPRTYHLPWLPGQTSDDKTHTLKHIEQTFLGRSLTITEKLDGENQTWTRDEWHLRSEGSNSGGVLRSRSKATWAQCRWLLKSDCHYFVEDLSNVHSILYDDTSQPFWLISLFDQDTALWAERAVIESEARRLGLQPVTLLARWVFHSVAELEAVTAQLAQQPSVLGDVREGVVVRLDEPLPEWTSLDARETEGGQKVVKHSLG